MRILYFTQGFTPHDHRFLASLAAREHEVFYLRLERRGRPLEDRALPPSVKMVHWAGGQGPFRWRDVPALLASLRGVLRQVQPHVLHAGPMQTVAFLAALSGFQPLVSMSWGSDLLLDADRSRWYRWLTTYSLRHSRVLVGDCEAVRQKAASFGFPPEKAFIFPWGIDLQRFSPGSPAEMQAAQDFRARQGWQDAFVVLSLRSWEPVYGVDVAVRGFARAAQQDARLRLLLLGGGSLAPHIHQLIQQYSLLDRVFLGGQVPQNDLARMVRCADLYLSASHSDGSSVSLMEALACGKPALLSDIPGNREWVTGAGQVGWLFADGSEAALADGLLRAAQPATDLAAVGARARALAEQRADWKLNFPVLLRAYECALGRAGQTTPSPNPFPDKQGMIFPR